MSPARPADRGGTVTEHRWTLDVAGNPAWDHERLWDITGALADLLTGAAP